MSEADAIGLRSLVHMAWAALAMFAIVGAVAIFGLYLQGRNHGGAK